MSTWTGGSILIALAALVVLIGSIAFSKRKKESFGGGENFARPSAALSQLISMR